MAGLTPLVADLMEIHGNGNHGDGNTREWKYTGMEIHEDGDTRVWRYTGKYMGSKKAECCL